MSLSLPRVIGYCAIACNRAIALDTLDIGQAKSNLSKLLDLAIKREEIVITQDDKPAKVGWVERKRNPTQALWMLGFVASTQPTTQWQEAIAF